MEQRLSKLHRAATGGDLVALRSAVSGRRSTTPTLRLVSLRTDFTVLLCCGMCCQSVCLCVCGRARAVRCRPLTHMWPYVLVVGCVAWAKCRGNSRCTALRRAGTQWDTQCVEVLAGAGADVNKASQLQVGKSPRQTVSRTARMLAIDPAFPCPSVKLCFGGAHRGRLLGILLVLCPQDGATPTSARHGHTGCIEIAGTVRCRREQGDHGASVCARVCVLCPWG